MPSELSGNELIPIVAITGGILMVIVGMIAGCIRRMYRTTEIEKSRREIAAYVAEGTISAEDAAKLLAAGTKLSDGCAVKA